MTSTIRRRRKSMTSTRPGCFFLTRPLMRFPDKANHIPPSVGIPITPADRRNGIVYRDNDKRALPTSPWLFADATLPTADCSAPALSILVARTIVDSQRIRKKGRDR
jgi:hypothetical protein